MTKKTYLWVVLMSFVLGLGLAAAGCDDDDTDVTSSDADTDADADADGDADGDADCDGGAAKIQPVITVPVAVPDDYDGPATPFALSVALYIEDPGMPVSGAPAANPGEWDSAASLVVGKPYTYVSAAFSPLCPGDYYVAVAVYELDTSFPLKPEWLWVSPLPVAIDSAKVTLDEVDLVAQTYPAK